MSVSSFANFVTAVGALAPVSGNTYQCISLGALPLPAPWNATGATGSTQCKIQQKLKGAGTFVDYQTGIVYEGVLSQYISADDANPAGASLRFVGADGVQKVVDAQSYINALP